MSARKKHSGILLYNKILHSLSVVNKTLPDNKKLSLSERRELISGKLYPELKSKKGRVYKKDIESAVQKAVSRIPSKNDCDVLAIPIQRLQSIEYYAMDEFITRVLPNCIYMKVDAGEYGETKIFNTRDYDYYKGGLSEITNAINADLPERHTDDIPAYDGMAQVRPAHPNNGRPENYYIHFVLKYEKVSQTVLRPIEVPKTKKTKKQKKIAQTTKKNLDERVKNLYSKKSKSKALKRSFFRTIEGFKVMKKGKEFKEIRDAYRKKLYKEETKRAELLLRKKDITPRQYREIITAIKKAYK